MSAVDMAKINPLIDDTPYIADLQRRFYKTMIEEWREKMLVKALQRIRRKENELAR